MRHPGKKGTSQKSSSTRSSTRNSIRSSARNSPRSSTRSSTRSPKKGFSDKGNRSINKDNRSSDKGNNKSAHKGNRLTDKSNRSADKPRSRSTSRSQSTSRNRDTSRSRSTSQKRDTFRKRDTSRARNSFRAESRKKTPSLKIGGEQIEGRRAVLELLLAGRRKAREIYFASDLQPAPILEDIQTIAEAEQIPIRKLSKSQLFQMAHTDSPQGVVALARPLEPSSLEELAKATPSVSSRASSHSKSPAHPDSHDSNLSENLQIEDDKKTSNPFLLVLDGIVDTANFGSLMRSAECAGVTGIVLSKNRSAKITPATAKAAAGAIEYLPIALVSSIPSALERLKDLGVWTVGLDAEAPSRIYDINIADSPIALVIGAESTGLKKLTKTRVDVLASIPIRGRISSLNSAVASAIACFEIQRLRNEPV